MGKRSVMAVVGLGNDDREHLTLGPGERRVAKRDGLIEHLPVLSGQVSLFDAGLDR